MKGGYEMMMTTIKDVQMVEITISLVTFAPKVRG